jgi:hypothetical protein
MAEEMETRQSNCRINTFLIYEFVCIFGCSVFYMLNNSLRYLKTFMQFLSFLKILFREVLNSHLALCCYNSSTCILRLVVSSSMCVRACVHACTIIYMCLFLFIALNYDAQTQTLPLNWANSREDVTVSWQSIWPFNLQRCLFSSPCI